MFYEDTFYAIGEANGPYLHMPEFKTSAEAAEALKAHRDDPRYKGAFDRLDRVFRVTRTYECEDYEWYPKESS